MRCFANPVWRVIETSRVSLQALPLMHLLSKSTLKERHWLALMHHAKSSWTLDREVLTLRQLMESGLFTFKDAIEDVVEAAEQQAALEAKLADMKRQWATAEYGFTQSSRAVVMLTGHASVLDKLEDSQLVLQAMLSGRHIEPFRDAIVAQLLLLSEVNETLDLWSRVQQLWSALEPVFTSGDIARQMPAEAKKFARADKEWTKLMTHAEDVKLVVDATNNEQLK